MNYPQIERPQFQRDEAHLAQYKQLLVKVRFYEISGHKEKRRDFTIRGKVQL